MRDLLERLEEAGGSARETADANVREMNKVVKLLRDSRSGYRAGVWPEIAGDSFVASPIRGEHGEGPTMVLATNRLDADKASAVFRVLKKAGYILKKKPLSGGFMLFVTPPGKTPAVK